MLHHRRGDDAHDGALKTEHWFAWLLSATALVLGLLGLLRAYGIIGPANTTAAGQVTSVSPGGLPDSLWDGGVLLLAAIAAAFLAYALHQNDHHRLRDLAHVPDREETLWKLEHLLAYSTAIAAAICTGAGLLTAFNKVGGHRWQPDGIPWLLTGIGLAVLTNMFHAVRHHQFAHNEERPTVARSTWPLVATDRPMDTQDFVVVPRRVPRSGAQPQRPTPADPGFYETQRMPRR